MTEEGKFLGEEDNSQMCKTCKHLKQLHPRPLYCEVKQVELPFVLGYCNGCPLLFKRCKSYGCLKSDDIFHSCDKWELDEMKKRQSEQNYKQAQLKLLKLKAHKEREDVLSLCQLEGKDDRI